MSCLQPWTEDIFTLRANPGCQHDWSRNQLKDILLGGSLTVSPQEINWGRTDSTFWLWAFTFCCLQALMLMFPPCPTSDPAFSASIKHGQKSSDPLTTFWLLCQTRTSKTSSQVDWVLLDSHTPLMDCLPSLYLELSLSLLHNMHSFYQLHSLGTPWLMHFSLHLLT